MIGRAVAVGFGALGLIVACAGLAAAHVEVQPAQAATGAPVTMAGSTVGTVRWSGGRIEPGHADYFPVSTGPLPTDVPQLVFTADQSYSDGSVVAWNQPHVAGRGEPSNPAPVLEMNSATAAAAPLATAAGPATTAVAPAPASTATRDSENAAPVPLIGVAGAAAAVLAVGAIGLFRFRPGRSAPHH